MRFLVCLFCQGELDIFKGEGYNSEVKCQNCQFSSKSQNYQSKSFYKKKEPEVFTVRPKRE